MELTCWCQAVKMVTQCLESGLAIGSAHFSATKALSGVPNSHQMLQKLYQAARISQREFTFRLIDLLLPRLMASQQGLGYLLWFRLTLLST